MGPPFLYLRFRIATVLVGIKMPTKISYQSLILPCNFERGRRSYKVYNDYWKGCPAKGKSYIHVRVTCVLNHFVVLNSLQYIDDLH